MQSIVLQLRGLSLISTGATKNVQRLNIGQIALLGMYLSLGMHPLLCTYVSFTMYVSFTILLLY